MTQHLSPADTAEDKRIMRQLATVVGGFFVFTIVLAVAVGVIMS
jgi:hypothetical protein